MLVSYNWLNSKYFDGKLPSPNEVGEALTFHAWELEEIKEIDGDTVLDVKVLPDKSMWALSHRGIAKDLSVILNIPLTSDPLKNTSQLETDQEVEINLETENCRRFAAAKISGVKVGPSPEWLKKSLEAIGQRSINNIVDASNYVMFDLGQPSHAFDASLVGSDGFKVRDAKVGEKLTGLDGIEYTFTADDVVIARNDNDEILSIAGLKGGQHSGISDATTDVIVEVANWNPIITRKTGQRLKLRTDASSRYENGIVPEVVPFGLNAVVNLIIDVAGGTSNGYTEVVKTETPKASVAVTLEKINSVLGVNLSEQEVTDILNRFGWEYTKQNNTFLVTSPFERTDLNIPEDVIEEIGRIYGYEHVAAVVPEKIRAGKINKRFYYTLLVSEALTKLGFSEIYTSSFRNQDKVHLANALATDKEYLRSSLKENMREALAKNISNTDLLGLKQVRIFELGTVFESANERLTLCLGVQSPSGYKEKLDKPTIDEAIAALSAVLGNVEVSIDQGVVEIEFGELVSKLPEPSTYPAFEKPSDVTYKAFSVYPAIARDIAMWVEGDSNEDDIVSVLKNEAGPLCVRVTKFDQFEKDGRTSYAYRLVFQSYEKTLTDTEINTVMEKIYEVAKGKGWEVR